MNAKRLFGIKWGKTHLTTERTEITENFKRVFSVGSVDSVVKNGKPHQIPESLQKSTSQDFSVFRILVIHPIYKRGRSLLQKGRHPPRVEAKSFFDI